MSLEERASLALLAAVLGSGESSRLVRTLQYERQVVNGVFAYGFDPADPPHGHRRHHRRCSLAGYAVDGVDSQPGAGRSLRGERRCARACAGAALAQVTFQNETVQDEASRLAHFELLSRWLAA